MTNPLDGGITFTIDITKDTILTSNQRLHHHAKADRVRVLRRQAWALARAARLEPIKEPCQLYVRIANATRNRLDPANFWPTIKPVLDGLVDAGLLADDDSKHLTATTFARAEDKTKAGTYRADLTFIPESHPAYTPF